MKYEVTCNTKYDGQIDLSIVSCESDGMEDVRTQVIRQVINTQEKYIRNALINLGWVPPTPSCPAPAGPRKCIVNGCKNHTLEGKFVGALCAPCHDMLTSGIIRSGATFIHDLQSRLHKIGSIAY